MDIDCRAGDERVYSRGDFAGLWQWTRLIVRPQTITSAKVFKHMASWTKDRDVCRMVIGPITVFVMAMQNFRFLVPTAPRAPYKRLFHVAGWLAINAALNYSEFKLFLTVPERCCTCIRAKSSFNLSGVASVSLSAMNAIADHVGLSWAASVKAGNRAITNFRGWHDGKSLAAVFACALDAVAPKKDSGTFGTATLSADWPMALKGYAAIGAFG